MLALSRVVPDRRGGGKSPHEVGHVNRVLLVDVCLRGRTDDLNPANGWGDADGCREFLGELWRAFRRHPNATVRVSR